MSMRRFACGACGLLALALLAGAAIAAQDAASRGTDNSRYKLQNGDVVDLNFSFAPEFNQTLTVQPDGYVTLREVGDLRAAGLSVPELQRVVAQKYAGILKNPVVTVEMKDFEKPYFLAQGEVAKPGKYDLRGRVKLSEAVAIAGGFAAHAKHSQVLLFRRMQGEQVQVKEIDVKKMLGGKNLSQDVQLQSGDMVFVPKNRMSKISPFIPLPYFRVMIPGLF
jgi:polysaccharide biosynthesis/export protein